MLKCGGRRVAGCGCDKRGDMSSSTCSSISSLAEEGQDSVGGGGGGGGGGGRKSKMEVTKQNTVGNFLAALSPRNLFKGLRRADHHSMPKAERTMKAAILIQRWYRRYMARIEIRRRYTWTIFQSIEYQGEQDQLKLYNFFNALLTHIPTNALNCKPVNSDATSKSSSTDTPTDNKFEDESPSEASSPTTRTETNYRGIHLGFPLQRRDLDNLIESFRRKKNKKSAFHWLRGYLKVSQHRLHAKYVAGILKQASSHLKNLPNFNQVSTAISKQVTICGDLHGKLDDLLVIFHKNGLPSAENPYVFNGDFVDRGRKSVEVLLLLLVCLLIFPDGVFLNRGNHEDHVMNTRYGFIREVKLKYKHNAERLLKLIENVYRWLPLGTLVNNKVLVVHGGISDKTDLETIKNVERQKYISLLRPPVVDGMVVSSESDKLEWKQVFDILWSDPQRAEGCVPNSLRGAGTYFGPDVTQKFLEKHGLIYLIRSHECKPDGYEIIHNGKVITIFSASNYYETGSNKGAYLKLVGPELKPHFVQFTAGPKAGPSALTFRQKVGLIESSAIRELISKVHISKNKLLHEFSQMDPNASGYVSVTEWCTALEKVTSLSLPWRMLRPKLASLDKNTGMVLYMTTFQENVARRESDKTVAETLYKNKASLEAIFRIIDKDNSGFISVEEFKEACSLIGEHLDQPTESAVDICKSMDMNKDGLVDLNEFLETFRLVESQHSADIESDEEEN